MKVLEDWKQENVRKTDLQEGRREQGSELQANYLDFNVVKNSQAYQRKTKVS